MQESKAQVDLWLNRRLDRHYQVVYFDATFVHTRCDASVSKEAYYTFVGVKEDGTREVLSVVNHPTEGAIMWEEELKMLKMRGVEGVGLFVSDALNGVEDAVKRIFPRSKHQFCVVHLKRAIFATFPQKDKKQIVSELNEVIPVETKAITPMDGFSKLCTFVGKYERKYPSLKRFKSTRNIGYFTYLEFPEEIQRMIYSSNWIERLNRDYKRVLKMRAAIPSAESVIALMGAVAMEKERTTYSYPVVAFRNGSQLKAVEFPNEYNVLS